MKRTFNQPKSNALKQVVSTDTGDLNEEKKKGKGKTEPKRKKDSKPNLDWDSEVPTMDHSDLDFNRREADMSRSALLGSIEGRTSTSYHSGNELYQLFDPRSDSKLTGSSTSEKGRQDWACDDDAELINAVLRMYPHANVGLLKLIIREYKWDTSLSPLTVTFKKLAEAQRQAFLLTVSGGGFTLDREYQLLLEALKIKP